MRQKYKVLNVYHCHYKSDKGNKIVTVSCENFSQAARLANIVTSYWEDRDAYELVSIVYVDFVATLI